MPVEIRRPGSKFRVVEQSCAPPAGLARDAVQRRCPAGCGVPLVEVREDA